METKIFKPNKSKMLITLIIVILFGIFLANSWCKFVCGTGESCEISWPGFSLSCILFYSSIVAIITYIILSLVQNWRKIYK